MEDVTWAGGTQSRSVIPLQSLNDRVTTFKEDTGVEGEI